jgi:hypothetical protein
VAPWVGTAIQIGTTPLLSIPLTNWYPVEGWHIANAVGLTIGYLVTFGIRKHYFGSKDLRVAPREAIQYFFWFNIVFATVSIVGAYVLVEFLHASKLLSQIAMSALTSLVGRKKASDIFKGL